MNKHLIATALAAAFLSAPFAATAGEAELLARIDKMAAELEQLKAELKASVKKTEAVEQRQQALASAPPPAAAPATAPVSLAAVEVQSAPATIFGAYGEVNYNRPSKNASGAQADVRRAVIGIEHRFDQKTKMVAEFEWEHAVVSASDKGESEVEQLYVEREFGNGLRSKVGLYLIPMGLLNTNHEPTAYYGVERNFVETAIIPSTWREVGVSLSGDTAYGLTWDTGITTGFDLGKWDAAGSDGRESPLGSIHQEGQQAKSRDLSVHAALNWRGVPGLLVGGSIFTGKAGHKTDGFTANDARITMVDLHTRYTPGRWDLSALYARGQISNTEALNETLVGNPTPVPKSFAGWYTQAAYRLMQVGDYTLSPFARYEQFNTAKSYAAVPQGLGVAASPDEKVTTVGANLKVGEGVVLKADYQWFKEDKSRDRLNLGMGFSY
ncbi:MULTISPECIES: hypothetical protein [unclassified Duganella]|uniref:hypothetical protein n=1 Tax=unclassified Duganella TaxID=2636909 RepID=UPI000E352B93|nr:MULTISPECIES: hypothetical protein [unclassified Duganella]RFP13633.1 hypothetical protein D0T23_14595 [Duganella sp. BJB475]RFP36341.1 hypothetical protein D0T21_07950 [Duganella sp. BJB476]